MTGVVLVAVLFSLIVPLLLYSLIRVEHDNRETMDRMRAERTARRDTDDEE